MANLSVFVVFLSLDALLKKPNTRFFLQNNAQIFLSANFQALYFFLEL
jgi:hypothetical protein